MKCTGHTDNDPGIRPNSSPKSFPRNMPCLALCLALLVGFSALAGKNKRGAPAREGPPTLSDTVGTAQLKAGLFNFYQDKQKLHLALPASLIGVELGFVATRVTAAGDFLIRGGNLDSSVVVWRRKGQRMVLQKQNLNFRSREDSTMRHAVNASFVASPVFMTDLVPVSGGELLIDASEMFGPALAKIMPDQSGFVPKPGDGTLLWLKTFPDNIIARVSYRVEGKPSGTGGGDTGDGGPFARFMQPGRLADSRFLEVIVDYHFYRLPEDDYRPRFADERVGGIGFSYKDYSDVEARDTAFRHLLIRWDLRKTNPEEAVSPALKPITFYVDRAVPDKWRPLIHQAGNWWNESFEKIGIRDAIHIRDQPDDPDFDPADLRHSMIYWNLSDDLVFSGLAGPMYSDPRSGKVLRGNVYLNAEFPSYTLHRYLVYAWWRAPDPNSIERTTQELKMLREPLRANGFCDRQASFSSQIAFARLVLRARGQLGADTRESERFAREAFLELTAHEIGHALGFPHNWKASLGSSWEDVRDGKVTGATNGNIFSYSVMDYNPIYLAPKGRTQGDFFMTEVGPYDDLTVEYIYKPLHQLTPEQEAARLDAIAARAETEHGLVFDGGTLSDIDPSSNSDDFGDNPLEFAASRLEIMQVEVLPHLPELVLAEGHDYSFLRQALDAAIFSVALDYIDLIGRHIGGQILLHRVANSAAAERGSGPPPIEPVTPAIQRKALQYMNHHVFRPGVFSLPPESLALLKADHLYDWNYPWRYASDYSIGSRIEGLYNAALGVMLQPNRLARVLDNERRTVDEPPFTLPELFGGLVAEAFGETPNRKGEISSDRRALQRQLVSHLLKLAVKPDKRTPVEASQVAALELRALARNLNTANRSGYEAAHLEDLARRIQRNLEAGITLPTGK